MRGQPGNDRAEAHQATPHAIQEAGVGRIATQSLAEARQGLVKAAGLSKQLAQQACSDGLLRRQGHGVPCLGVEVGVSQTPAQPGKVVQGQRVQGLAPQRSLVGGNGLCDPPYGLQGVPEVVVRVGGVEAQGDRLLVSSQRLTVSMATLQRNGQVVPQCRDARVLRQRRAQRALGRLQVAGVGLDLRLELPHRRRRRGGQLPGPSQAGRGFAGASRLLQGSREVVVRVCIGRLQCNCLTKCMLGFGELSAG
ncbi:MAG: hypothetical protein RLZZ341_948 [Pseudomonadota bacterium]